MLKKLVINQVINLLAKNFKLFKVLKYVEEPNELDEKVEELEKRIKKLERDSHPRADWICMKCGCKAKKYVKKTKEK